MTAIDRRSAATSTTRSRERRVLEAEPESPPGRPRWRSRAPTRPVEPPADLDARREWRLERLDQEAREPEERPVVTAFDRPRPEADTRRTRLDPVENASLSSRAAAGRSSASPRGPRSAGRTVPVRSAPATQGEPVGGQGRPRLVGHRAKPTTWWRCPNARASQGEPGGRPARPGVGSVV